MKKFIKNVVLIALGTLTVCSSEINDKYSVTQERFNELLLTGKSPSGKVKLSLNTNQKFFFKLPPQNEVLKFVGGTMYKENIPNVKRYQIVEIKNGYLLVDLDVLNKKKEVIQNVASGYVIKTLCTNNCKQIIDYRTKWHTNRLSQILMLQLPIKASLDIFPKYPIVLRSAEEPSSLNCLTLVPKKLYYDVKTTYSLSSISAGPELGFESDFKIALADATWEKLVQTIGDYKLGFSKEKGVFEKGKTIADYQSFQQAKEELFTLLYEVNSDMAEPYSEPDFLKYVYQKDKELNDVFFGDKPISSIVDNKAVYDKLNSKDMKIRNTFAKALLLNALFHPDRYSYPELNEKKYLVFTPNYGQIARWLQHINPDDDFNHICTYGEFKNRGDLKFDRSFWVLKEGRSYIDFYKTVLGTIAVGKFAYNVNNVEINQRKVKNNLVDSVVIDVEYKKADLKLLFENMVAQDGKQNEVDTNGVRFVLRYNGLWDLVTAYPIYIQNSNSEIQQSNSVLEELKNFVNLKEYPKIDSLAVVWGNGNKRLVITKDLDK